MPNGNTFHEGRDGAVTSNNVSAPVGSWTWVKQAFAVPTAGEHTVHLWMREDGLNVDRLLLAQSAVLHPDRDRPRGHRPPAERDSTAADPDRPRARAGRDRVAVGANVVATFSEAMDPATLTGSTFTLAPTAGGPAVTATIAASAGEHDLHAGPRRPTWPSRRATRRP